MVKHFFSHYSAHKESVQEARRKATERLQQAGADESYVSEFAAGSRNGGYGSGTSGFASGNGGYGTGLSAGLTAGSPDLCTVPCERYLLK